MHALRVDLSFNWETVLRDGEEKYLFPQPITKHMRRAYRGPAVYRWNIYDERPTDKQLIYIGQTQELSPDRIRGYLKPGPSQKTNQRLLSEFNEYLEQGLKICLEVLRFGEIIIGDLTLTTDDMHDGHVRQFIEGLLITYYTRKGFTLLNL
jgi:hypothetical protein